MAGHHVSLKLDGDRVVAVDRAASNLRRCDANQIAPNGDCLKCGALDGEACPLPKKGAA